VMFVDYREAHNMWEDTLAQTNGLTAWKPSAGGS
jgi:hypothetical protein